MIRYCARDGILVQILYDTGDRWTEGKRIRKLCTRNKKVRAGSRAIVVGDGGGTYGTAQSALLSMRVGAWPSRDPLGPELAWRRALRG